MYDATKGAVEQFTRILAKEFGSRGITVNTVSPGATETETYREGKSEQFLASLEAMSAFGRLGQPDEIATVVAFLASDAARWVTSQNIRVPQRRHRLRETDSQPAAKKARQSAQIHQIRTIPENGVTTKVADHSGGSARGYPVGLASLATRS